MAQTAKIFQNGRSQAVRLPQAFRFEGSEVYVRRDEETGDVILSRKPSDWGSFFRAIEGLQIPADFLSKSERGRLGMDGDPFEGFEE
jgi:antitoxin VapB